MDVARFSPVEVWKRNGKVTQQVILFFERREENVPSSISARSPASANGTEGRLLASQGIVLCYMEQDPRVPWEADLLGREGLMSFCSHSVLPRHLLTTEEIEGALLTSETAGSFCGYSFILQVLWLCPIAHCPSDRGRHYEPVS